MIEDKQNEKKLPVLTSAGEKDLDGHILQQITSWEDRADFGKVPFSVQMVAVFQHLKQNLETDFFKFISLY